MSSRRPGGRPGGRPGCSARGRLRTSGFSRKMKLKVLAFCLGRFIKEAQLSEAAGAVILELAMVLVDEARRI